MSDAPLAEARPADAGAAARRLRLLVVEDSERDAALLVRELKRAGYALEWERVETAPAMQAALARGAWDLVIADYTLPQFSALAALRVLQESGCDLPFMIVSGTIGEDSAVAAMKAGAHDYIMKGHLARLIPAIDRELREAEVRRERARAEAARREEAEISAALARVGHEMISSHDAGVLVERLCRVTTEVLGCDCSHTVLWKAEEDAYLVVSGFGDTPEQAEAMRVLKLPAAALDRLRARLETDEVVQVHVGEDDLLPVTVPVGVTTGLYVALRRAGDLIGLQTAGYRQPGRAFGRQQQRIAAGIAQLASMALENAQLVAQLERANRLKSDFVATMSHELRTPLHIILGFNDLILEGNFGPLAPRLVEALQRVRTNARQLHSLIDQTLNLSRLEGGQAQLTVGKLYLADLCAELAEELGAEPRKPAVALVWKVPPLLPAIHTDALKLKVVLRNLVDNALKFTEQGSVTVEARVCGDRFEVSVFDTGVGIAPEALPIIFEPFRQGDSSATRRYGGVGLGLYVVRRILDMLRGGITVESRVGHGSCFRVSLPAEIAGSGAPPAAPSA
jgi:signal transduction histidine kinase/FixJ family two-component response regulator